MGTKTTVRSTNPDWVNNASRSAVEAARSVADQEYTPYTGDRVAQLDQNERMGSTLASQSAGQWRNGVDAAGALYGAAEQDIGDKDLSAYRNPYMQGALNVGDRELTKSQDIQKLGVDSQFAGRGGLGNSRRGVVLDQLERDQNRDTVGMTKNINKADTQGALGVALNERNRKKQGAGAEMRRVTGESRNISRDIQQLYGTGENARKVDQAFKDFDYTQYREGRDWDVRNLNNLMQTIGKVPHDTKTTTTVKTGGLGGILGLVGTAIGAYYGGAKGAKIGGSIGNVAGGAIDG